MICVLSNYSLYLEKNEGVENQEKEEVAKDAIEEENIEELNLSDDDGQLNGIPDQSEMAQEALTRNWFTEENKKKAPEVAAHLTLVWSIINTAIQIQYGN